MKKHILLLALLSSFLTNSQEEEKVSLKQNEFKVNAAYLIAGFPEFTYEKRLNNEASLGITLGFSINNNNGNEENNNAYSFSVIPYYRIYFGEKPSAGFFIDGNLALYSQKQRKGDFFSNAKEGGTGLGIGFNVGKKYTTKKGWVGELSMGITRTLINADKIDLIYPRAGIIIGKVF
ncbi:MAG: DUF3575 domain-containing protein [Polaribacter sp.]